jgi:hypothetical protein
MGIIDDSAGGPLGRLKDDLLELDVSVPSLVRILWWYTDPTDDLIPDASVLADITNLINELPERLAGGSGVLEIWKRWREDKLNPFDAAVRTYLNRFGMEHSLVPDDKADNLRDFFTQSITPLRPEHLDDSAAHTPGVAEVPLIPAARTLRDFKESGIEVRLTRTNFRTGRLEVSAYNSPAQFGAFLKKHWFRFDNEEGLLPSLGNARLQTVGNPNAIYAALASGRFPGVFSPIPVNMIYGFEASDDLDNRLFAGLLADWLNDEAICDALTARDEADAAARPITPGLLQKWRESEVLSRLFPKAEDHYVDGGAIDNTPANSAIDAIKDWMDEESVGYRDYQLDLYTIFLHPPPEPGELVSEMKPSSIETVRRTMEIRTAAVLDSDAAHVRFVNRLGQMGEDAGETIIELATALENILGDLEENAALSLSAEQRAALRAVVATRLSDALPGPAQLDVEERLAELKDAQQDAIDRKLPLPVNPIEIHPEEMPMRTLQFTERLGYKPDNAIRMMASGCYSTLWSLFVHLSEKEDRDEADESVLRRARQWMGLNGEETPSQSKLRKSWRCQRESCVFHARHCRHGAMMDE